jgi:hypothetical protein
MRQSESTEGADLTAASAIPGSLVSSLMMALVGQAMACRAEIEATLLTHAAPAALDDEARRARLRLIAAADRVIHAITHRVLDDARIAELEKLLTDPNAPLPEYLQ